MKLGVKPDAWNEQAKNLTRADLEQEFVNLYRRAWGSNAGLTTDKLERMTDRQLRIDIGSLRRYIARMEPELSSV